MSSTTKAHVLSAVRGSLVVAGIGAAVLTVHSVASMPPPPPESDGFVHGMALLFGSVIAVLSLGVAAAGVVLPTLLGTGDPLGFGRWQRRALKGAGLVVAGGFALGVAYGSATEMQFAILLWLLSVAAAVVVVCATLAWRFVEATLRAIRRLVASRK